MRACVWYAAIALAMTVAMSSPDVDSVVPELDLEDGSNQATTFQNYAVEYETPYAPPDQGSPRGPYDRTDQVVMLSVPKEAVHSLNVSMDSAKDIIEALADDVAHEEATMVYSKAAAVNATAAVQMKAAHAEEVASKQQAKLVAQQDQIERKHKKRKEALEKKEAEHEAKTKAAAAKTAEQQTKLDIQQQKESATEKTAKTTEANAETAVQNAKNKAERQKQEEAAKRQQEWQQYKAKRAAMLAKLKHFKEQQVTRQKELALKNTQQKDKERTAKHTIDVDQKTKRIESLQKAHEKAKERGAKLDKAQEKTQGDDAKKADEEVKKAAAKHAKAKKKQQAKKDASHELEQKVSAASSSLDSWKDNATAAAKNSAKKLKQQLQNATKAKAAAKKQPLQNATQANATATLQAQYQKKLDDAKARYAAALEKVTQQEAALLNQTNATIASTKEKCAKSRGALQQRLDAMARMNHTANTAMQERVVRQGVAPLLREVLDMSLMEERGGTEGQVDRLLDRANRELHPRAAQSVERVLERAQGDLAVVHKSVQAAGHIDVTEEPHAQPVKAILEDGGVPELHRHQQMMDDGPIDIDLAASQASGPGHADPTSPTRHQGAEISMERALPLPSMILGSSGAMVREHRDGVVDEQVLAMPLEAGE